MGFTAYFLLATLSTPLPRLSTLNAADGITVSGISSGAYMAHQIHIAFSKVTHGAGIVAGGPYFCAGDPPKSVVTAQTTCMKDPNRIDVDKLLFIARNTAAT